MQRIDVGFRPPAVVVLAIVVSLVAVAQADAAPIPPQIKIPGASCDKPLQVRFRTDSRNAQPAPRRPYDDRWLRMGVVASALPSGRRQFEVSWTLDDEVELCEGSYVKFGFRDPMTIRDRSGAVSDEVSATAPVQATINARFVRPPTAVRDDLGPRRLKTLVARWARRACALRSTNPEGAGFLGSLAIRAGGPDAASACRPPKRVRPTAVQLLHHAVAYFNRTPGDVGGPRLGREYYRVLEQLTIR